LLRSSEVFRHEFESCLVTEKSKESLAYGFCGFAAQG
jgi:hypothetical protein